MDLELSNALGRIEAKFDALDGKFDSFVGEHVPRMATIELRVTRLETDQTRARDRRWPLYVALVSSITSPICAAIVAAVVLR